jgi:hypothetical protein
MGNIDKLTAEHTENAEKKIIKILCGLCGAKCE